MKMRSLLLLPPSLHPIPSFPPLLLLLVLLTCLVAGCKRPVYEQAYRPADPADVSINEEHPLKDSLERIMEKYVDSGIPGVQVALKNADGWYIGSGGFARVEDSVPFNGGQFSWYYSISKIYTACLVMKQLERGRIDLDAPIAEYLPADIARGIEGSNRISVRMLLSNSSGIESHTAREAFYFWQFNNPLQQPGALEKVEMSYGKPLRFEPGTDFFYVNINYLLLSFILEEVSGKSYATLLQQDIIEPLGLQQTYFQLSDARLRELPFHNSYFDRFGNEQLENISRWNNQIGNNSGAYGGIAGTPADAIRFMEAWVSGRVVSEASREEMMDWIQGRRSPHPDYGLGLEYYRWVVKGSEYQYGHKGDGLGNTTQLLYVPANDSYLYINILVGGQLDGPYLDLARDLRRELCSYVSGAE